MKSKYKWADTPRTIIHDKASYFVPALYNRLQIKFAEALERAGFRSWVGGKEDSAEWMVRKFGDVYIHETVISHVRRLLDGEFAHRQVHETPEHFKVRMDKVVRHMNSAAFVACGGSGVSGLAKQLRDRCEEVVRRKGERLPK